MERRSKRQLVICQLLDMWLRESILLSFTIPFSYAALLSLKPAQFRVSGYEYITTLPQKPPRIYHPLHEEYQAHRTNETADKPR